MLKYYLLRGVVVGGFAFAISVSGGRSIGTSALGAAVVGILVALLPVLAMETGKIKARLREERLSAPLAELAGTLRMRGLSVERGVGYATLIIADKGTAKSFVLYIKDISEPT